MTPAQQKAYDRALASIEAAEGFQGSGKRKDWPKVRTEFLNSMRNLEKNNPDLFSQLVQENPVWGVRYDASLATGRYFKDQGIDPKMYKNRAAVVGYSISQDLGYGEDGKQDGKSIAAGYGGPFKDVNNENGPGDFFKLGTPNKMKGGLRDFIEDNPLKVAGMAVSFAMPWLSAPLASALGVTTVAGQAALTGVLAGGTTLATGGDAKDALLSGIFAGGTSFVKNSADFAAKASEIANGINNATGLSVTGEQLTRLGLVSVKGDPVQGAAELVVGEGLEKLWEGAPELSAFLDNAGIEPEAISATVLEGVKSGGDPLDMARTFVEEGGLPNFDVDINMPDFGQGNVNWGLLRDFTDPLENAINNVDLSKIRDYTDPLEEAGQYVWDAARDATDPLERAGQGVMETVQALPWPEDIQNPLPDMNFDLPNVSMPDIPTPDAGLLGDVPWQEMLALGLPFLAGNNNNNNNQNKGVMDVSVAPQDMSYGNFNRPDYGTVEQKGLLPGGGPIFDLLSDEEKEKRGLI